MKPQNNASRLTAEDWRQLAKELKEQLLQLDLLNLMNRQIFSEEVKEMIQALLHTKPYQNNYSETRPGEAFAKLYGLLSHYFKSNPNALVLVAANVDQIQSGQQTYAYLVNFLLDSILLEMGETAGLSEKSPETPKVDFQVELDELNAMIHQSNQKSAEGKFGEALQAVDEVFRLAELLKQKTKLIYDKANLINNRAFYLFCLDRCEEALTDINKALALQPDSGLFHHTKAEILDRMGKFKEALTSIDKAIELENSPDKQEFRQIILGKIS